MNKLIGEIEDLIHRPADVTVQDAGAEGPAPMAEVSPTAPSDRSATPNRTLLIHGYSASGKEFQAWKDALVRAEIDVATIEIGNYISLNNEITIKDLGEAFDRALRLTKWSAGSKDDSWTFDAVVHSTGMLIVRQWLTSDPFGVNDPRSRVRRLKHLVGLAPATFGSPQGKKGRSWLGALVKGNRDLGPDFMNAGDMVLDGLELGSGYTWDLALHDMLGPKPKYDQGPETPYVAVFIGNAGYSGISAVANSPGSDGTVRWAGCALNTRMVQLDFRRQPGLVDGAGQPTRLKISDWVTGRLECPIIAVEGRNHGSILSAPDDGAVERVSDFLRNVKTADGYQNWLTNALAYGKDALAKMDANSDLDGTGGAGWQQFVMHVKDDHGDGVADYNVQLFMGDDLKQSDDPEYPAVPLIVDTYSGDSSYRCFYVRLSEDMLKVGGDGHPKKVWMELIASSGTAYLEYEAYNNPELADANAVATRLTTLRGATNAVKLDVTELGGDAKLFFPYTTTLIEIVLEREPTPLGEVSSLFAFWQPGAMPKE
ncbi:MAG: hypothetical protein ABSH45_11660 [Bryobacteraceae bacterium]